MRDSFSLKKGNSNVSTVAIVSSLDGEGKSVTAYALARTLAVVKNVALLEVNFRNPTLGRLADHDRNLGKLSHCLNGKDSGVAWQMNGNGSLSTFVLDFSPDDPSIILTSKKFSDMLSTLSKKHDLVILDAPSCLAGETAAIVCSKVDAVLFVAAADSTSSRVIRRGLDKVSMVNRNILGVILSKVNLEKVKRNRSFYKESFEV